MTLQSLVRKPRLVAGLSSLIALAASAVTFQAADIVARAEAATADSAAVTAFARIIPQLPSDSLRTVAFDAISDLLFEPQSAHRDDTLYVTFLSALSADTTLSDYQREIARYRLEHLTRLLPGNVAPDFPLTLTDGNGTTLHRLAEPLNAPVTLLFYDPECDECRALIERLSATPGATVIAVNMTDTPDLPLPAGWYAARGADPDVTDALYALYFLRTLPATFTLHGLHLR